MVCVMAWIMRGSVIFGSENSPSTFRDAMLNLWSSSDAKEVTEERRVVAGEAIALRLPVLLIDCRTVRSFNGLPGVVFTGVLGLNCVLPRRAEAGITGGPMTLTWATLAGPGVFRTAPSMVCFASTGSGGGGVAARLLMLLELPGRRGILSMVLTESRDLGRVWYEIGGFEGEACRDRALGSSAGATKAADLFLSIRSISLEESTV